MRQAMLGDRDASRSAVPAAARVVPGAGVGVDLTRRRVIDHGTVCSAGCPES